IYQGVWRDYSAAGLNAIVLTLPLPSAGYLISAMTFLLTLAVTSCWTAAYALHQYYVSRSDDPLDLQLQVLLRNVGTPRAALRDMWKINQAWKTTRVRRDMRIIIITLVSGIFVLAMIPVSTLVTSIASKREEAVLVLATPRTCGYVQSNFSVFASDDGFAASYGYTTAKALRGRAYAKAWYGEVVASQRGPSSIFLLPRLPYDTYTAPCPLGQNRCRFDVSDTESADKAIVFDTRLLDTGSHLGINGPREHMIQFRRKTSCSPTRLSDLWGPYQEDSENYTALRAGPWEGPGNITLKFNTHIRVENVGYLIVTYFRSRFAVIDPGATQTSLGTWRPIPLFEHDDALLTLHAILPNVGYLGPVNDPIFQAMGKSTQARLGKVVYYSDYFITSLVCLDQVQFCNQNNGKCTDLTHHVQAVGQSETGLGLNEQQLGVLKRIGLSLIDSTTYQSGIATLGSTALLASELVYNNAISPPLPDEQWIREVTLWFQTGLSILQEQMMLFLDISALNDTSGAFILEPVKNSSEKDHVESEWQCTAQKIQSQGQVQNFNFAVVMIITTVAASIVILAWTLDSFVGCVRKRRDEPNGGVRQFARNTDNLYWLLHAGLQG
ncbi:hypothetical protein EDB81DRAFT_910906, partial [Dactylonectria macrodidyma]